MTLIPMRTWVVKIGMGAPGRSSLRRRTRFVKEKAAREAAAGRVTLRCSAPSIDVEMSDDSGTKATDLLVSYLQMVTTTSTRTFLKRGE